ncbi:MAG: carbohydrate ABC transporter permease [Spirochaetia bacterium]|jgi:raffinose/stachyose/melibiose transport system permease protein|uniref:Binding-protein-dependent transport systems inner membrane component n=1 Tax=uncultured spirochete TaxID=156406 RepID=A0A3P3XK00_9SPIR|nr:carbohydrate ABC transporter permease [Rectinema subterraneum]MDQ7795999.1 carbohydrate ABC transporter permease [Spirochaetia bacterium]SLM14327.1 Binding-protein-dependent transport systems inner membrane component [uncultured spirochete]
MMFKLNGLQKAIAWIFLALLAFVNLYPIGIMILSSFKSTREIFLKPFNLPAVWRWSNYVSAWQRADFATYFKNSILVTAASIAAILLVSSMAAYVIARFDFKFKRGIYLFLLAGLALPTRLAIIPIFLIMRSLHLLDKLSGLVIVYAAGGIAFSVFLLVNFFKKLPRDIEDSAKIDGAGPFRIYWQIDLPLLKPALVTVAMFNFIDVWNDFFFPLILLSSRVKKTIPLGLQAFFGEYTIEWDVLFAALNISVLPILIIFLILSKQFIAGMTEGALK